MQPERERGRERQRDRERQRERETIKEKENERCITSWICGEKNTLTVFPMWRSNLQQKKIANCLPYTCLPIIIFFYFRVKTGNMSTFFVTHASHLILLHNDIANIFTIGF